MMILTKIKNNQRRRYLAKTWYDKLALREVQKNNYRATGDVKKSKEFVSAFTKLPTNELKRTTQKQPIIIFSRENETSSFIPAPVLTG